MARRSSEPSAADLFGGAPWTATRRGSAPDVGVQTRKEIMRLAAGEKIFDLYHWNQVLQESGDGGKVVICEPKKAAAAAEGTLPKESGQSEQQASVLKMKSKESLVNQQIEEHFRLAQLALLNMPPHPGVLAPRDVLEDEKMYYIVMDRADGGTFFEGLIRDHADGTMPPHAVRRLLHELLKAVGHIHKHGVLHKDIKPDNLVMRFVDDPASRRGKSRRVALIDFDYAAMVPLDRSGGDDGADGEGGYCGTYRFSAPETFCGRFSRASDLYSVGAILYLLMTGKMPYPDDVFKDLGSSTCSDAAADAANERSRMAQVVATMRDEDVDWTCSPWAEQPLCRNFCERMLRFDHNRRFQSAEEALAHEWFR